MLRNRSFTIAVVLALAVAPVAALDQGGRIPAGATVYIEDMANDLDGFIRAELVKQKVPLRIVLSPDQAELIITGSATEERNRKWHEGWLTVEQDRTTGNIMVVDKATNTMLWAGEAGDRSVWLGPWVRGGQRKVASRLVKSLKKAIAAPRAR